VSRLDFEDGVHCVSETAGSVDDFRVLHSELDHAVECPDCRCSGVLCERAEVGKVGRGKVLVDGEFGAHSVRDWVGHLGEGIVFV